ncbi:hypothetical protein BABINDRAFT_169126 [Babjeviella inositovora NRRL Y-12698]|uniref:Uncharacterized protein n=1 Tax=Babjeviella inositovora NRRL Y-12698 TaxID=984486 RepID=A0A1E3QKB4_9ASCO|nr:uncharacterized protein BABINDRAFT_169126 [Babjeviella inositovora NRRL Y-12698]ODQ77522.1 hypothetical protein BABINDRAFT_169126 [Babjeviella inositovora NRRL Y-12698]
MPKQPIAPQNLRRLLSWTKKPEYEVLAKALNLLSSKPQPPYKPSLFKSAITADKHLPVTAGEKRVLSDALSTQMGRKHTQAQEQVGASVMTHYADLIRGLDLIHTYPMVDVSGKNDAEICDVIRCEKIQSEFQIINIFNQVRGRASYAVMNQLLTHPLTKNITPFMDLLGTALWLETDALKYEITVLKKLYEGKHPLTMIDSPEYIARFLPAMLRGDLPDRYQRLLWKFHFMCTPATLDATVERLMTQKVPITPSQLTAQLFLIWESMTSAVKSVECAAKIHHMHKAQQLLLNDFQAVFVDFINESFVRHNMKNRNLRIVDGRKSYSLSIFVKRFSIATQMNVYAEYPYSSGSFKFDVNDLEFARLLKFRAFSQDLLSKLQLNLVESTQANTEGFQLVDQYRKRIEEYLIDKIAFETKEEGTLTLIDQLKAEYRHTLVSMLM